MILSDGTIRAMLASGELGISPLDDMQIQPASVDVRIGNTFSVIETGSNAVLRLGASVQYRSLVADRFLLLPGQFVLASTMEYFRLPNNMTAFVEGRSSIGRLGLFIQNAGWVDPGFEGEITLELFNASSSAIELKAGRRVGQLVFARMDCDAQNPYSGKYQGQRNATGSRIHMDEETD